MKCKCFADCNVSETLETSTNIQNPTSLSEDVDENKKHEKLNTKFPLETIGLIAAVSIDCYWCSYHKDMHKSVSTRAYCIDNQCSK